MITRAIGWAAPLTLLLAAVQPNFISLVFLLAFLLILYFSSKQAGRRDRSGLRRRSLWGGVLVLAAAVVVVEAVIFLLYIARGDGWPGTKEAQLWFKLLGFTRLATWKDTLRILFILVPQFLVVLTSAFALSQEHQYSMWGLLEDSNGREKSVLLSLIRSHSLPIVLLGAAVAEPSVLSTIYFFFSCMGLFEWSVSPDTTGEWMLVPLLLYNGLHILLLYLYQLLHLLNPLDWGGWVELGSQIGLFQFVPYSLSSWLQYIQVGTLVLLYVLLCDSLGSRKKDDGSNIDGNECHVTVSSQPSWVDDANGQWASLTSSLINSEGGVQGMSMPSSQTRSRSWVGRFEKCSIDFFTYGFPVCLLALSAWSFMYISMLGGVLLLYVALVLLVFPTAGQLQRLNPLLLLFIILWMVASYLFTALNVEKNMEFWNVIGLQKEKQPGPLLLQYVLAMLIGLDLHVSNNILRMQCVIEPPADVETEVPQENDAWRKKILALAVMGWCVHKSAHVISLALLFIVGVTAPDLLHSMYMFFFLCYLMWPAVARKTRILLVLYCCLHFIILYVFRIPWSESLRKEEWQHILQLIGLWKPSLPKDFLGISLVLCFSAVQCHGIKVLCSLSSTLLNRSQPSFAWAILGRAPNQSMLLTVFASSDFHHLEEDTALHGTSAQWVTVKLTALGSWFSKLYRAFGTYLLFLTVMMIIYCVPISYISCGYLVFLLLWIVVRHIGLKIKSAMWLPIVLFATIVLMFRYVFGAFPDFKDFFQREMNLGEREMGALGLKYSPDTPLYLQLWDTTLLLCVVQLHRTRGYRKRASRRSLHHQSSDVAGHVSVATEDACSGNPRENIEENDEENGNGRCDRYPDNSDSELEDREYADCGSEMGDINDGYLGFLKRLLIVHCHKPVVFAIFYASLKPVCTVGLIYLLVVIFFFDLRKLWGFRAKFVVIYTAVVMTGEYWLQVAAAEDGIWSPEFEMKMRGKALVLAACVLEHSCMWWRDRLPSHLKGELPFGDNCLLFLRDLRRSGPVMKRPGVDPSVAREPTLVIHVPPESADSIQGEGRDHSSCGKRRRIDKGETSRAEPKVVGDSAQEGGVGKASASGALRTLSFDSKSDAGRGGRRWSRRVIQDIRQCRYQAQMETLQRYIRYVVEHFFLLYGLEISMLTLLLAAFAVLNAFSLVYVSLLAICIILPTRNPRYPQRSVQCLWPCFVFLFATILVTEYIILWRETVSQGEGAKPCSTCWYNKEPRDHKCWSCWLGLSADDPQMLWPYFLVFLVSTYQLKAYWVTAKNPGLVLSPVAKLSDSMGWSKILFETKDQWTWLDHLRFLFYRNMLLVVLVLVFVTGTLKYDLLHFGYLAFSLIFFHLRLSVMKKRNAVFSLLRLYNFLLIVASLVYQAPWFVYRPNGVVNVIGLYKYKYGFRTEFNLDFRGPCPTTSKECSRSAIVDITIFVLVSVQSWVFKSEVFEQVLDYIEAEQVEALAKAHEHKAEWKKKQLQHIREMEERKRLRRAQVQSIKEWLAVSDSALSNPDLSLTKFVDRGGHRLLSTTHQRHPTDHYLGVLLQHPRPGASTPTSHVPEIENEFALSSPTRSDPGVGGTRGTATRPFSAVSLRHEYALESPRVSSMGNQSVTSQMQNGGRRGGESSGMAAQSTAALFQAGEKYLQKRQKGSVEKQQVAADMESARGYELMRARHAAAKRGVNASSSSGGNLPSDILGSLGAHAIYDGVQFLGERVLANLVEFLNLDDEHEQDEKMSDEDERMDEHNGKMGNLVQGPQRVEIEEEVGGHLHREAAGKRVQVVGNVDILDTQTRPDTGGLAKRLLPDGEDKSYILISKTPSMLQTEIPEDTGRQLSMLFGYIKRKLLSNTDFVCYFLFVVAFVWNFSFLTLMYPAALFIYALQSNPGPADAFWVLVLVYTELNILGQYTYQVVSVHITDFHPLANITLELLGIRVTHMSFVTSVLPLFLVYLGTLMHMSYRDGEWMQVDQSGHEMGRKRRGSSGKQKRVQLNLLSSIPKALVTYWRALVQGCEAPPYFVQVSMKVKNLPQPESIESGMNRLLAGSYQLAWNSVHAGLENRCWENGQGRKGMPSCVRVESIENSTERPDIAVAVLEVVHAAVLPDTKAVSRQIWQDGNMGYIWGERTVVDEEGVGLTPSADVAREIQKMVDEQIVEAIGFPYPIVSVVTGQKQEADFHAYTVGVDLLTFIYVLCFYQLAVRDKSPFAEESYEIFEDQFPKDYFYVLMALFFLMVADRVIYLCAFSKARVLYYFSTLILFTSVVMWMFWTAKMETGPVSKEESGHSTFWLFRVFYLLKSLSLALTALQLKYGHPTNSVRCGQFLMRKVGYLNRIGFAMYRALPFVFELRSVLDWACMTTSLPLYDWLKLEDIYASLFMVQCDLKLTREGHKLGERQDITTKFCNGFCLFSIIILIIWLPMFVFSTGNPVNVQNPVIDVQLTLSLYTDKGTFPLYQGGKRRLIIPHWKPENNTWLRRFDESNIQLICCYPDSDNVWQLPRPVQQSLASYVDNSTRLQVLWQFLREKPLGKEMIMNELEAASGKEWDEKIIGMLSGSVDSAIFPDIYPKYWRLPGIGKARPLEGATEVKVGAVLSLEKEALPWWTFTRDNNSAEADCPKNASGPVAVVVSDEVPGYFIGETISKMGITGLYLTFVMSVGRFLRLLCSDLRMRIPYENFPSCDRLMAICEDIYAARAEGELELEEQLFWTLIKIYRSPHILTEYTKGDKNY